MVPEVFSGAGAWHMGLCETQQRGLCQRCVRASIPAHAWKEQPRKQRACSILGGFSPRRWARHSCGAAGTLRGDLAVPPGHCSAGFVGQEHFPSCLLLDKGSVCEGNCGVTPSCLSQSCTPQVPFGGSWSPPMAEEHSSTSKVQIKPSRNAQPKPKSRAHELFASVDPLHYGICKGR